VYPPIIPTPIKGVSTPALKTKSKDRASKVPWVIVLSNKSNNIGKVQGTLTNENNTPRMNNPPTVLACFLAAFWKYPSKDTGKE
jgi:hypothetical protein